jgi:F-type H+-transporting ATPase subunit alpha
MAIDELNFDPSSIADALRRNVESYRPSVERQEVGRVVDAGDGIARVKGLPNAMANELLEFPGGLLGLAFNLDEDEIGCVLLGDYEHIEEGALVKQTGQILSIPVGDGFLGRVIDPLGQPIDGRGPIQDDGRRNLEVQAANVVSRQPVKEPLQTGIKAIDRPARLRSRSMRSPRSATTGRAATRRGRSDASTWPSARRPRRSPRSSRRCATTGRSTTP